ncbi:putative fibronectin type III domain-containing protein [Escherichia coli P0302293.6]|nr:putative fibronectin type III domain-containing protein [Escherichia coli P0302293.6]
MTRKRLGDGDRACEDTQAIARYGRNVTKMDALAVPAGGRHTAPGCG